MPIVHTVQNRTPQIQHVGGGGVMAGLPCRLRIFILKEANAYVSVILNCSRRKIFAAFICKVPQKRELVEGQQPRAGGEINNKCGRKSVVDCRRNFFLDKFRRT
jgi:hypothetical protein